MDVQVMIKRTDPQHHSFIWQGVLALGQEKFESAKLQWAAAVAGGVDLKAWNSEETLSLFRFAEERMKTAAVVKTSLPCGSEHSFKRLV